MFVIQSQSDRKLLHGSTLLHLNSILSSRPNLDVRPLSLNRKRVPRLWHFGRSRSSSTCEGYSRKLHCSTLESPTVARSTWFTIFVQRLSGTRGTCTMSYIQHISHSKRIGHAPVLETCRIRFVYGPTSRRPHNISVQQQHFGSATEDTHVPHPVA